jgi:acyl-coenzyme A synthetase/AMP-(fatty) acid ligase
MATVPLLLHRSPDSPLAYRGGAAIDAAQFLADVDRLAAAMPSGKHVLNVCADRYNFAVGFAAALTRQKISLLPSTHTPEVIRQLVEFSPDVFCLTDVARGDIDLPQLHFTTGAVAPARIWRIPQIDEFQLAAYVFTSGSTGIPVAHPKTWGKLSRCVRGGAALLGLADGRSHAILGTVPAQHMYGFESSVLAALQSGNALCAERPFYPADICSVLSALPRPRVLVTTPIHLRALHASEMQMPAVDLLVCATAPLSENLARDVEAQFAAPLIEIYGSTETGQIATRRTAREAQWRLWPQIRLTMQDGQAFAQGGHIEQITPISDVLEMLSAETFLLHGRKADLVNIAGKRSSFAYLNHHLNAIPGVLDGVFFLRDEDPDSSTVTRLAAAVVASGIDAHTLLLRLRDRIDPVFLPRPIVFVDRLPRNATGKLPQQALQALIAGQLKSTLN